MSLPHGLSNSDRIDVATELCPSHRRRPYLARISLRGVSLRGENLRRGNLERRESARGHVDSVVLELNDGEADAR